MAAIRKLEQVMVSFVNINSCENKSFSNSPWTQQYLFFLRTLEQASEKDARGIKAFKVYIFRGLDVYRKYIYLIMWIAKVCNMLSAKMFLISRWINFGHRMLNIIQHWYTFYRKQTSNEQFVMMRDFFVWYSISVV